MVISMETTCQSGLREVQEPKVIEVERKFVLGKDSDIKLRELGAELVKQNSFRDVYYDTVDNVLARNDHWLRTRDNQWQLKCPPRFRRGNDPSTQYAEYEKEETILKVLQVLLLRKESPSSTLTVPPQGCGNLQGLVQKASLNEFAQYTTHRKTYVLDGFTIDLDLTDFGFQVGEIEVVVADESRITEALRRIDELAVKLGRYQSQL